MINEICKVFNEEYKELGDDMIVDDYTLAPGDYAMFTLEDTYDTLEFFRVDKNTDREQGDYKNFAKLDLMSGLISMNKPIDSKKVIHSNNIYAFFIKKDNLDPKKGKLNDNIIDEYYNILKNPSLKYKNKRKSLELYLAMEKVYEKPNIELIDRINLWIKENIFNIGKQFNNEKTYLKLFYNTSLENYKGESEKYILPNIYNSTDYNVKINGKVYGLPDFNMGLNAKKPYLENKTRKNKLPVLVDMDKIKIQKKLFDYLMNHSAKGKNYLYIDKEIEGISSKESNKNKFKGYFLRVTKGKEVQIEDSDNITGYDYNFIKGIEVASILEDGFGKDFKLLKGKLKNIGELKIAINEVFFYKWLNGNLFTEAKKISINDNVLKRILIQSRYGFYTWFYKGDDSIVRSFWNKVTKEILYNSMSEGNINGAINQFNLRHTLLDYFENKNGGENMARIIENIRKDVDEKINIIKDEEYKVEIDNDKEYYFCIGQLMRYFYVINKSNSKNYSFLRPLLVANDDKFMKEQLKRLFVKYSYAITGSIRFNNMYYMVAAYESKKTVDQDAFIAGFLCPNLILKKQEENSQNDSENTEEN
ncbi:MAG: hypothetical protein K0R54_4584 [Clostridiaceae bacterium]|nr:hypothetical protein [Clostridiaceae bacterium]